MSKGVEKKKGTTKKQTKQTKNVKQANTKNVKSTQTKKVAQNKKPIKKQVEEPIAPTPISNEVIGFAIIGLGLLIVIGIFSTHSGLFGKLLRSVFVGGLGIGGYILPIGIIIIGLLYVQGEFEKLFRFINYGSTLVLLMMITFHLVRYSEYSKLPLVYLFENVQGSWQDGGYIGAIIGFTLLKLIGTYGTYFLLIMLFSIWLLMTTQFPVFAWLHEVLEVQMDYISMQREEKAQIEQENNKNFCKLSPKEIRKEKSPKEWENDTKEEIAATVYPEQEVTIPFFDSNSYKEESSPNIITKSIEKPIRHIESPYLKKVEAPIVMPDRQEEVEEMQRNVTEQLTDYQFPPITLLKEGTVYHGKNASKRSLMKARKLEDTLASFGVEAKVTQIHKGPSVTRYELQPKQGVKVSKIVNLSDDIALNLAATHIRIEAPIPGKAAVGIEVANSESEMVYLRDVIETDYFKNFPSKLAFALGKDIAGKPIITDIGKMPHLLIAGATGSGKSVCINTLITSLIYKATPDEVKLIMIDPKVVELSVYNGIPHLLIPVVTDPKKAAGALFWAVNEMTRRYQLFAESNVRDMKGYNEKQTEQRLPQIVIIIDELADLMMTAAKEVEDAICRLAQMARAAGIHLVIATQRPSVDVITGVIKANIPSRLAFAVSSGVDSRTILDMVGAEKLLGKGDMLFYPVGESKPIRIQGAFISDQEVESIVSAIQTDSVDYEESVTLSMEQVTLSTTSEPSEETDELLDKVIEFAKGKEKLSISMLQRYFRIGFNRASRLMDALEAKGIVGPDEGSKPRKVL